MSDTFETPLDVANSVSAKNSKQEIIIGELLIKYGAHTASQLRRITEFQRSFLQSSLTTSEFPQSADPTYTDDSSYTAKSKFSPYIFKPTFKELILSYKNINELLPLYTM